MYLSKTSGRRGRFRMIRCLEVGREGILDSWIQLPGDSEGKGLSMVDMLRVYPIFVQFGVGAVLCGIGLYCGYSSGYIERGSSSSRRLLTVVVGGYLALLAVTLLFTFVLPQMGGNAS